MKARLNQGSRRSRLLTVTSAALVAGALAVAAPARADTPAPVAPAPIAPAPVTPAPVAPAAVAPAPVGAPAGQLEAQAEAGRSVSFTFSPIHLILPVVEVTAELRLAPRIGVAAIAGVGSITHLGDKYTVLEAGAQLRFYALGSFQQGLEVGLETLYVGVSGDNLQDTKISGAAAGLAMGPFIGYKYIAPMGLTLEVQAGASYAVIHADTSNGGSSQSQDIFPLVNLNAGWSF